MAPQPRQFQMGGGNAGGSDTTYSKIFVGGLAWETQRDTMHRYFEQFGEILEAVVITDKNTGRSKGYGFVTFKDPDSATRACQDPSPVIDGRRANCNLASLGAAHRTRPPTASQGTAGRFRPVIRPSIAPSTYHGPAATTSYFHQPAHFAYPYSVYGYSGGYSQETMHPMGYYSLYGGGGGQHHQFSSYYAAAGPGFFQNFYHPFYAQVSQDSQAQSGYGLHYSQMLQYSYFPQQYRAGILSMPPFVAPTAGATATAAAGSNSLQQPPRNTSAQKPSP